MQLHTKFSSGLNRSEPPPLRYVTSRSPSRREKVERLRCYLALACGWQYADVQMPLLHVEIKQSLKWDESQAGMQAAVCGGDHAAAKLAHGTFVCSDCRESGDFGHGYAMSGGALGLHALSPPFSRNQLVHRVIP